MHTNDIHRGMKTFYFGCVNQNSNERKQIRTQTTVDGYFCALQQKK